MVKMRAASYCNLKLVLVFLVIYGHWIEPSIYKSEILLTQYRSIYLFHMPLFVFLSGLFLNSAVDCIRQIKRLLPTYALCQTAALMCGAAQAADTPWWILWYLLSYCFWAAFGALWFGVKQKRLAWILLPLSVLAGCAAGYLPQLNRTWSGSRTVVFFPYFFAGLLCSPATEWKKYRRFGVLLLAAAAGCILLWGHKLSVSFLYHASGFGTVKNGFALRMLCYGIGSSLSFFMLTCIPGKRFSFTKAGANTLPAYLLHGPAVLYLRKLDIPWIFCLVLSAFLLLIIYKLLQWNSALYGVIPAQRRDRNGRLSGNI